MYQIKKCYPNIDSKRYFDEFQKYYVGYFGELFSKTKNLDEKKILEICKKYEDSQAPELIELSNYLKLKFNEKKDNSQSYVNPQGKKAK